MSPGPGPSLPIGMPADPAACIPAVPATISQPRIMLPIPPPPARAFATQDAIPVAVDPAIKDDDCTALDTTPCAMCSDEPINSTMIVGSVIAKKPYTSRSSSCPPGTTGARPFSGARLGARQPRGPDAHPSIPIPLGAPHRF